MERAGPLLSQLAPRLATCDLELAHYATVTPATKVELLKGVLADAKLAVVMEGEVVVGVVTKIDLIDYLTSIAAPQA